MQFKVRQIKFRTESVGSLGNVVLLAEEESGRKGSTYALG